MFSRALELIYNLICNLLSTKGSKIVDRPTSSALISMCDLNLFQNMQISPDESIETSIKKGGKQMTTLGLEYLKHQEQKRANLSNEELKRIDIDTRVSTADKDRLSRESIATADRGSRERVSDKDRLSREYIATADRSSREEISSLDRSSRESIASRDRASRETISARELASKENIARDDRTSRESIAEADRNLKEQISALDRTSKESIAALGRNLDVYLNRVNNIFKANENELDRSNRQAIQAAINDVNLYRTNLEHVGDVVATGTAVKGLGYGNDAIITNIAGVETGMNVIAKILGSLMKVRK